MRVTKPEVFTPITITLESQFEVDVLLEILEQIDLSNFENSDNPAISENPKDAEDLIDSIYDELS